MTPVRSRASIRHAWVHIEKARRLIGVDNEMAAFRAITAEEEAATGIIIALKDIRYAHSELLKPKDHKHKSGLWSLFQMISGFIQDTDAKEYFEGKVIEGTGENVGKLGVCFPSPFPDDSRWIYPVPPLNFNISSDGKNVAFQKQAEKLASAHNKNQLKSYISKEANLRNQLIYASQEGIPNVTEEPTNFICNRERRVMVFTYVYLLICQYPERQLFVQQCLDVYLRLLGCHKAEHLHDAL